MTFNMRHGRGIDWKVNLERIAELIKQENVDIVGLNEVDKHFSIRSKFIDQALWLSKQLDFHYAFGPAFSFWKNKREYGNAILSRYTILHYRNHIFRLKVPVAEPRAILEATINVDDKNINIFVSHLSIHPLLRGKMVRYLLNIDSTSPTILMGDFNCKPCSHSYEKLVQTFKDCFECESHSGFTFPAKKPRSRIDYIFTSNHFEAVSAHVVKSEASDHLPVSVHLKS